MRKDKPELYSIGEGVRVHLNGPHGDVEGEVIVRVRTYAEDKLWKDTFIDDPSRVSKLPPWEPKHGEQVYAKGYLGGTFIGIFLCRNLEQPCVAVAGEYWNMTDTTLRPITDDYASVGKPWNDKK